MASVAMDAGGSSKVIQNLYVILPGFDRGSIDQNLVNAAVLQALSHGPASLFVKEQETVVLNGNVIPLVVNDVKFNDVEQLGFPIFLPLSNEELDATDLKEATRECLFEYLKRACELRKTIIPEFRKTNSNDWMWVIYSTPRGWFVEGYTLESLFEMLFPAI